MKQDTSRLTRNRSMADPFRTLSLIRRSLPCSSQEALLALAGIGHCHYDRRTMEKKPAAIIAGGTLAPGFWEHPLWRHFAVALILWQGWMTLTLFGPDHPFHNLFSNEPIVSGKHALHLYHGYLGARSFYKTGSLDRKSTRLNSSHI